MRKRVGKSSGAPVGERAEQQASDEGADDAADEREEYGFREQLARDGPAAGADGETDGEFARAVGGARGEDAGEIGAGGEQYEHGEETSRRGASSSWGSCCRPLARAAHADGEPLSFRSLCHRCSDGVEVFGGLLRRYLA